MRAAARALALCALHVQIGVAGDNVLLDGLQGAEEALGEVGVLADHFDDAVDSLRHDGGGHNVAGQALAEHGEGGGVEVGGVHDAVP